MFQIKAYRGITAILRHMKNVLAFLSQTHGDALSPGAQYALGLARAQGAVLSVLVADIDAPHAGSPSEPNAESNEGTDTRRSTPRFQQLNTTRELILGAAKLAGIPCEILRSEDRIASLRERIIESLLVRDVLVIDVYGPVQSRRRDLIDGALFGTGRPVVLVPPGTQAFGNGNVVIAWDASRSAVRAVHDALPLLRGAHHVTIVSVIDDKAFPVPQLGDALCRYLARWNIEAEFSSVERGDLSVGATLLSFAHKANADLLVMGGFAHGIEQALMLGSATCDIFQAYPEIPVFMSH